MIAVVGDEAGASREDPLSILMGGNALQQTYASTISNGKPESSRVVVLNVGADGGKNPNTSGIVVPIPIITKIMASKNPPGLR
jgi:hypothetical protein